MRRQVQPASWFAELCEGGRLWPKRAGRQRLAPRQTSRKGTSRLVDYRIPRRSVYFLPFWGWRMPIRHHLRSRGAARMLVRNLGTRATAVIRRPTGNLST